MGDQLKVWVAKERDGWLKLVDGVAKERDG
jgi:hypothetical protein